MLQRLAFAALLLPLGGCVMPPPPQPVPYGYAAPGYPLQQDFTYPGYAFNDGSPTYVEGGVTWPLVFYGGGWGYWDGYHHWHGAPGQVGGWLGRRYPGGVGYHPFGGGPYGTPVGLRIGPGGYGPVAGVRVGTSGGQRTVVHSTTRVAAPARHREPVH
jgi:hypothetical protein